LGKKLGSKPSAPATGTEDNAPAVNKDSDEPKKGEDKDSADKEDKDEPKKGEDKGSEGGDKKDDKNKDGCNKDSANELFVTKDDFLALKKEIGSLVTETVKECLGIKEKNEPTGSALDSATKSAGTPARDYSSFLD
jgi:hypothetical protein